jgi:hypothetical protein
MWAYFGAVWVFVLVAFLLGVLLAWVFWVRPLREQLNERARRTARPAAPEPAVPSEPPGPVDEALAGSALRAVGEDAGLSVLTDRGVDGLPWGPAPEAGHPWDWAFTEGGWERTHPEPSANETVGDTPFGPGSASPPEDGSAPSGEFSVKARISSMVFHTRESPFYENLVPQVWFTDPETAIRAGFTDWQRPNDRDAERVEGDGEPPG